MNNPKKKTIYAKYATLKLTLLDFLTVNFLPTRRTKTDYYLELLEP